MNKSAAIVRKWKRIMAAGCSHGHLIHPAIAQQVIDFREEYRPHEVVHLGDVLDTGPFRSGARGSSDQGAPIEPDKNAAFDFLRKLRPTRITYGNHDWRLVRLLNHPESITQECARSLWRELEKTAKEVGAKTYPYHYRDNVCMIGGVGYMHGISYAKNSIEVHSNFVGGRVVHAHTHRTGMFSPNGLVDRTSFSVGLLADPALMTYAHERLATGSWSHGLVFGEFCETESVLWLVSADQGKPLRFPSILT